MGFISERSLYRYSATELSWNCRPKSVCECEFINLHSFDFEILYGRHCVGDVNSSSEGLFHSGRRCSRFTQEGALRRNRIYFQQYLVLPHTSTRKLPLAT